MMDDLLLDPLECDQSSDGNDVSKGLRRLSQLDTLIMSPEVHAVPKDLSSGYS